LHEREIGHAHTMRPRIAPRHTTSRAVAYAAAIRRTEQYERSTGHLDASRRAPAAGGISAAPRRHGR
jgi:hypothetical protein